MREPPRRSGTVGGDKYAHAHCALTGYFQRLSSTALSNGSLRQHHMESMDTARIVAECKKHGSKDQPPNVNDQ